MSRLSPPRYDCLTSHKPCDMREFSLSEFGYDRCAFFPLLTVPDSCLLFRNKLYHLWQIIKPDNPILPPPEAPDTLPHRGTPFHFEPFWAAILPLLHQCHAPGLHMPLLRPGRHDPIQVGSACQRRAAFSSTLRFAPASTPVLAT